MSWGSGSRGQTDYGWRPPTTMVDVIFLLLTFFITIASFREEDQQIQLSLPASQTKSPKINPGRAQIMVTVKEDGSIFMGDQEYTLDNLRGTLVQLAKQFPDESVVIRGDRESRLGLTVRVMDMAYAAGLKNVFLATTKPVSEVGQ